MLRLLVSGVLTTWLFIGQTVSAQRPLPEHGDLSLPQNFDETISEFSTSQARLAPEEIDRAILNRLMQEIARTPKRTASIIGLEEKTLAKVFISLSNAKMFIHTDEMRNTKAMCETWAYSNLQGDARVKEALSAYADRRQLTLNFVERFYQKVLNDIKSILSTTERSRFSHYMDDRRRRMADAATSSRSMDLKDVKSGAETINLYCRNSKSNTG